MDIQSMKISLVQKLLGVEDEATLFQVQTILDESHVVAYTIDGKPLTRSEYLVALEEAESEIESGDFLSHDEVIKISNEWN